MGLPEITYELRFYDLRGALDSAQQHTDEATARSILRLFDEPDSAEVYSRITLTAHDWTAGTDADLDALIF